ncbi:RNA-directed DNA polymerase, eukaryota, reverse transcriptase zinc-binding domain protein [Tanacetum coccineum]|uniref:RNA-directed DNA polymerase, eukaryota, reverse transcriptase zinc-binding domain protein n=1 Tax=Tanacetum coccineum TaxID=301880 RepID=A0ABQ5HRZ2_9ASTR
MSLRDKVREHIWWKIGNGNSVSAWHDKWSNASPLSDIVSARERFSAGLNNNNTVREIVGEEGWLWPEEWLDSHPELQNVQIPIFHSDSDDKAVWITNNGDVRKFEMKTVWNDLCNEGVDVEWYSMVWFPQLVPRHAFVMWLAVQRKLLTQDRIMV